LKLPKDARIAINEVTLWLFNIAMENGPFIDDFPIKTSIYKGFSMAMLNNQMREGLWLAFRARHSASGEVRPPTPHPHLVAPTAPTGPETLTNLSTAPTASKSRIKIA
jgi:hypothetical protein